MPDANRAAERPDLRQIESAAGTSAVAATDPQLGEFIFSCEGDVPLLFTENATNFDRLLPGHPNESPYVKDGINNFVVAGKSGCSKPGKAGDQSFGSLSPDGGGRSVRHRESASDRSNRSRQACERTNPSEASFGTGFDKIMAARLKEADEFYASVIPPSISPDAASVMRQAIAGMLWSKQFYFFDGDLWLKRT